MARRSRTIGAVQLARSDWVEIAAAVEFKAQMIREGHYKPCLEHGPDCTGCDETWAEHLERIGHEIGPDGSEASERGVEPVR